MAEKEISLLRKQIVRLNDPDFDLQVWKSTTILVLESIFGKDSGKINQVKDIRFDFSSWTLRDTSGKSPAELSKKLCRELLETAISELEIFGLPEKKEEGSIEVTAVQSALEDALRISQYRELIAIIKDTPRQDERKKKLSEKLQSYGDETVRDILAGILSYPGLESLKP